MELKEPIDLPKDPITNQTVVPVKVGKGVDMVTILSFGHIVYDRVSFHSQRYLYPVGYTCRRQYASTRVVGQKSEYLCEILDNGDAPSFRITALDEHDNPTQDVFEASSASGAWKKVTDAIKTLPDAGQSRTHASGPQLFGFSLLPIVKVVQELPGAEQCSRYVPQRWVGQVYNEETKSAKPNPNKRRKSSTPWLESSKYRNDVYLSDSEEYGKINNAVRRGYLLGN